MEIQQVEIETLELDPANVRQHSDRNLDAIRSSLKRFGQQKPIVINQQGIVIAGNGTLTAARSLGWDTIQAVETKLHGSEATAFAIADNRTAELAEWDIDNLIKQVNALELEDPELANAVGFDSLELDELLGDVIDTEENPYTAKVETPIYEPKGDKPETSELWDTTKTTELVSEITKADLPEDVRDFLMAAATRHTVFNFRRIADYYAQAEPSVQRLMEKSALVIIDFKQAIELGYVKLNEKMLKQVSEEYPDA